MREGKRCDEMRDKLFLLHLHTFVIDIIDQKCCCAGCLIDCVAGCDVLLSLTWSCPRALCLSVQCGP